MAKFLKHRKSGSHKDYLIFLYVGNKTKVPKGKEEYRIMIE
ncbi:hypothetical protein SK143_1032 [Streptococcus oralis]|uniref:Uncharacterized protein n=1 Tax=Streptococcus oralis TaxID=1303 RepID=A0A081R6Z8_STROR|nr:hypothetical protein SK143_1032 [Streptococcus oralis]